MPPRPDGNSRIAQSDFDRITGSSRDEWRKKWQDRGLVGARQETGYSWPQVVDALALRALEALGGMDAVIQCWDDVSPVIRSTINPQVLDLVFDPGTSASSHPRMRATVSFDDASTARSCRQAVSPGVIDLASVLSSARAEFDRVLAAGARHRARQSRSGAGRAATSRSRAKT